MSNKRNAGLTRRASGLMALEPRYMFDGAAVDTAVDVLAHPDALVVDAHPLFDAKAISNTALAQTLQEVQVQVRNVAAQWTDAQWMEVFGIHANDAQAVSALHAVQQQILDGSFQVQVVQLGSAQMGLSMAAFAAHGPDGKPTVFINSDWWSGSEQDPRLVQALIEEVGHSIDAALHPQQDTPGDEGQLFAIKVLGLSETPEAMAQVMAENDAGQLLFNGELYQVEHASFNFTTAYALAPESSYYAEKEQESDRFLGQSLGVASINDNTSLGTFSGNDVVVDLTINGTTYHGWISRPIKDQGVVRGFYFWYDPTFSSFSAATLAGNQDPDSNASNNQGFVLVVDSSWFSSITSNASNRVHDTGSVDTSVYQVGSSSDRVDSALNGVLSQNANVAPTATDDMASGTPSTTPSTGIGNAALEQGYNTNTSTVITASIAGTGRVLANDTDSNGDTLSVTTVTSKLTGATTTATSAGASLVGKYGTLTIKSDGNWTYTPNDNNATVNALLTGSLTEQFTYTASDGKGGTATATLTVQINGSNDAPVAANDYNSAKESLTDPTTGATTYAGYSATGNVLPNDTDVDASDTKAIAGASTSGTATGTTQANSNQNSTVLSFTSLSSSIKVGLYVFYDGGQTLDNNNGTGTTNLNAGATNLTVQSIDTVNKTVTLSGVVSNYTSAQLGSGVILGFGNTSSGNGYYKDAAIAGSTSQTTSVVALASYSGTIAIGMTVSGGGLPANTKVVDVGFDTNGNPTSVTISSTTAVTGASLTFSGSGTAGQSLAGKYGTLVLNSDGSYTYTPFADNPAIDSGDAVLETFNYTMQDAAGATSQANLYITVYGTSSTSEPQLTADTATAYESGVGRSATSPYSLTNDNTSFSGVDVSKTTTAAGVLGNDTNISGYTVNSYTKADGTGSTSAGSSLVGTYGALNIASTGTYTYTVSNSNATVNALLPGATLTETFRYKIMNGTAFAWSTLTITIQGTNDAPVAVADTGTLAKGSVTSASGNVLTNDTDVDAGDTKTVSLAGSTSANTAVAAGSTSANGLTVGGTYGVLTIGADGTYAYVLATASDATRYSALRALTTGATATETFNYQVKDANGATSTTTLTFTITGANEPPVNSYPASVTTTSGTVSFTNTNTISVSDLDGNLSSVRLHVDYGALSSSTSVSGFTVTGAGTGDLVITGTQTQINAYLAALSYTATGSFAGTDYLTIFSQDANNAYDSDGFPIITPATLAGPTVLESNLSTGSNPSGTGETASTTLTAPTGQNFGPSTQSGTDTYGTWTLTSGGVFTYTLTSAPNVSGSSSTRSIDVTMYDAYGNATTNTVTVTVTDDVPTAQPDTKVVNSGATATGNVLTEGTQDVFGADGAKVTSPAGGVVGVAAGSNTSTAVTTGADGTTQITGTHGYLTMNSDGSYTYHATSAGTDIFVYTIQDKDGDQSTTTLTITVNASNSPSLAVTGYGPVNENSTYAVFTVTPSNSSGTDLIDLSFTNGTATLVSPAIQYSTDGTTWTTYDSLHKPVGGAVFYVRVNITSEQDSPAVYEGSENFSLVAKYTANPSMTDSASTAIVDDGTGTNYTGNVTGGSPATNTTSLDDDRALSVNSITVNEGGGYAVFTVSANAGQTMNLALSDGTMNPTATSGTDYTNALEYWTGSVWASYTPGLTVPGGTANAPVSLYVRVAITNDTTFEKAEDFKLTATYTSGASRTATGVATIVDDGTGTNYDGNITGGNPATNTTSLNDDRALSVNSITVNEGDGTNYAVFSVLGNAGQTMTLALTPSSATAGADYTNSMEYWDGFAWTPYNNSAFSVPGTANAETTLLVRVQIKADNTYEGAEQFSLTAAYTSGASRSAVGTATIMDDGTGTKFTGADPTGTTPVTDPTHLDDDRPLAVSNVTVNEGSPYAVFEVSGAAGQKATLGVTNNTSTGLTTLQYFNGSNWQPYTPGDLVTLDANGKLLVRVALSPEQEAELDTGETFKLVATNTGGTASTGGNGTIMDDGTGEYFAEDNNSLTPSVPPGVVLDDDRPKAALPPMLPPVIEPPAPPAIPPALPPVITPPQVFSSSLQPLAPRVYAPMETPLAIVDIKTSNSGYQIPVSETASPGLALYRGVTDQFVQNTQAATKISLPFDAFIHSNKDAVIKLEAKQASNASLPGWVQFDPATGVFEVTPPKGFKGKLDLKVIARDDDGREAVAMFQMFIGEQTQVGPQSRSSFSEKLRMAGKRPVTLVRVAEGGPHRVHMADARVVKVRAG